MEKEMGTKLSSSIKLGDRVSRVIEMGNPSAGRRYGTVIKEYKSKQGVGFTPVRLFDVKWEDNGEIGKGYMEEGLQVER